MTTLTPWTTVAAKAELGARNVLLIRRLGIRFVVSLDSAGLPFAHVAICPHAWVAMPRIVVRDGCLICPLHGASFEQRTGAIVDPNGKRIKAPLKTVPVSIQGERIRLRIGPDCFAFVAVAAAKRVVRETAHLRKRLSARVGGR